MATLGVEETEQQNLEKLIEGVLSRSKETEKREQLKEMLFELVDNIGIEEVDERSEDDGPILPEDFSLVEHVKMRIAQASFGLHRKNLFIKSANESKNTSFVANWTNTSMRVYNQLDLSRESKLHSSEMGARNNSHGFGSAKRSFAFSASDSPGPAHYTPIKNSFNVKPSFFFDKSYAARSQFLNPKKDTPSPSQYFPSKHYTSH